MLRKTKPIKRRNSSNSSKDEDRKRQLEQFLNQGKVKKLEYQKPESRILRKGDLKHDHRCSFCDGWENEDGEFQHYEYCPKYKGSRRNPITSRKVKSKKVAKRKNPETIFGYIPQIGNLSVREIENITSGVDEAIELYNEGRTKAADAKLRKLENRFGRSQTEKVYFYRKYNS
mgnify:CR=1 FL=1